MENQFLFDFNFEDFGLPVPDESNNEPSNEVTTYCEETSVNGKKHHLCVFPGCGKLFRFKSEFSRHVVIHELQRPFKCPFNDCRKSFKREDALKNHVRIHTGEVPFKCEVEGCGMSFPTKAGLRYHNLKHKGEKQCTCSHPGCNKSFLTVAQLKQHESAVNYHRKVGTQEEETLVEETKTMTPDQVPITIPSSEMTLDVSYDAPTEKKVKKEDDFLDAFFAPNLKPAEKIEWEMRDQYEETPSNVGSDLQENFEKMVKSILSENNALKGKLDMCNTLMNLMQENNNLKQKLQQVTDAPPKMTVPEPTLDDKLFSFLNFNDPEIGSFF